MNCQLCCENPAIESSHGIPAFVSRLLKGSPPTVGMRCADAPNKAIQDLKKYSLLCTQCESLFNRWETPAAGTIFRPFCERGQFEFEYGPWLHKFMASLSWRTLAIKLGKYENDPTIPMRTIDEMRDCRDMTRRYLLGEDQLGDQIEQHVFLWDDPSYSLSDLSRFDINLLIRKTAVHEILIERTNGWSATVHNHAGCVYVMLVRSNPVDLWQGTRVSPKGGTIRPPQRVRGWLFDSFVQISINTHKAMRAELSEKQRKKIAEGIKADPGGTRRLIEQDPNSNILD